MPMVTFHVGPTVSNDQAAAVAAATQAAIVESIGAPEGDLFQRIHRHGPDELIADPTWGGVNRQNVLFIDILMVRSMHTDEAVSQMMQTIANKVSATGIRREDVFIAIYSNGPTDWFAGA